MTIIQPGQIEDRAADIPRMLRPLPTTLFAVRADRFRQLASHNTSLASYLEFLALLADSQQQAANDIAALCPLPTAYSQNQAGPPFLIVSEILANSSWHTILADLLTKVTEKLPEQGRRTVSILQAQSGEELTHCAEALLSGDSPADPGTSLFLGAALQVQFAHLAAQFELTSISDFGERSLCPVCSAPPVASLIHADGTSKGLRYLHCTLCQTQWHMVRSKCSNCTSGGKTIYYGLEGDDRAKAECCTDCNGYLKVFYQEKDHSIDPVADDTATLALDLLMAKKGLARTGLNFFMIA